MRIKIIRHGKVNMKWPKKCSSGDFDMACAEYDRSDLESLGYLDDVILLPMLVALTIKFIPMDIIERNRQKAPSIP